MIVRLPLNTCSWDPYYLGLLVKLMAGDTSDCRRPGPVTIDASFHGEGKFAGQRVALHHRAVALSAINVRSLVLGVAEDDEISEPVNSRLRKRLRILGQRGQRLNGGALFTDLAVARHAFGGCGKSSALRRARMAVGAAHPGLRMLLVAEADRLSRQQNTRG